MMFRQLSHPPAILRRLCCSCTVRDIFPERRESGQAGIITGCGNCVCWWLYFAVTQCLHCVCLCHL